jgi:hypothetical protein
MEKFTLTTVHGGEYEFPYMEENGFGGLWVVEDSMGIEAIIRAETYEKAYQCWVDEIAPDPIDDDIWQDGPDGPELVEGYEYRSSGVPSNPKLRSPIASIDLNGVTVISLIRLVVDSGHWLTPKNTVWEI